MKITLITGSSRKNGTSNYLAEQFIKAVTENGHKVFKFDSAHSDTKACIGCNNCEMGNNPCVFEDDFSKLKENILSSDIIVFVTPVYYFGFSSQIKKVIDRFYSIDMRIKQSHKKGILISVQHSQSEEVTEALKTHYNTILNWLNIKNIGVINAVGIECVSHLKKTEYPQKVYELGKSI